MQQVFIQSIHSYAPIAPSLPPTPTHPPLAWWMRDLPVHLSWWVKLQPLRASQQQSQPSQLSWTVAYPSLFLPTKKVNRSPPPKKKNKKTWTKTPQASLLRPRDLCFYLPLCATQKFTDKVTDKVQDLGGKRAGKGWQENRRWSNPHSVATDSLQNGEISLVVNKMQSPTPKWGRWMGAASDDGTVLTLDQSQPPPGAWAGPCEKRRGGQ